MALFGPYPTIREHLLRDPRFAEAVAYVDELLRPGSAAGRRLGALGAGTTEKIELSHGTFALEQAYLTKTRPEVYFESHRRMIDVQVVVSGAETMAVEDITRLAVTTPYDPEKDLVKYAEPAGDSPLVIRAGDAAVFFPADGHMPTLRVGAESALVRKSVVKVPVTRG